MNYYSKLLPDLLSHSNGAIGRHLNIKNRPLNDYLKQLLSSSLGDKNCLMGDVVFEPTFGWQTAIPTLDDLTDDLLDPELIKAMDMSNGEINQDYRFPKSSHPYVHQQEAWRLLSQKIAQSVVVTSGTGSGKTECFLIPILSDLINQQRQLNKPLEGVQALLIYPLNALIASQRERLDAWTSRFGSNVRFCLYNRTLPESTIANDPEKKCNHVLDRKSLWKSPPPILVTNATMLEYMLLRKTDEPILSASQGKLKYIVLDEAHSYLGAKAAELTLLLRRVMLAFGVTSEQVRFIATSATLGGPESEKQLQQFLAAVSGLPLNRVHVVKGSRYIPKLGRGNLQYRQATYQELEILEKDKLYNALSANQMAVFLRDQFIKENNITQPKTLLSLRQLLNSHLHEPITILDTLQWIDLLSSAKSKEGQAFLPLRMHVFHSVLNGVWACTDPKCISKHKTLSAQNWPFGSIYLSQRTYCDCGEPVFEVRPCFHCHEPYLWASYRKDARKGHLIQPDNSTNDAGVDSDRNEQDADLKSLTNMTTEHLSPLLIMPTINNTLKTSLGLSGSHYKDYGYQKFVQLACLTQNLCCTKCNKTHTADKPLFVPFKLGANFFNQIFLPRLLHYAVNSKVGQVINQDLPHNGNRLITFSDSRQGTARTALKSQYDAEVNWLRSAVYNYLLDKHDDKNDEKQSILFEIEMLKQAYENVAIDYKKIMNYLIDINKNNLNLVSKSRSLTFDDLARYIKNSDVFSNYIFPVYREYNSKFFNNYNGKDRLVEILILREFAKRFDFYDGLEKLGLVSVVYPKLDKITVVPDFVHNFSEVSLLEWKALLKIIIDFFIRDNLILMLPLKWIEYSGYHISNKILINFSDNFYDKKYIKWIGCNHHHKIIDFVAKAFGLHIHENRGLSIIHDILKNAFDTLLEIELLNPYDKGFSFSPKDMAFRLNKDAYICPITNQLLDTTIRNITPFVLKSVNYQGSYRCQNIAIPIGKTNNDQIEHLRALGHWNDLNDAIIEGVPYFRVVEHSAQQKSEQLQKYEKDFRQGLINIMSCSTTMEMGVDIGGISVVAMNNVPPHPANYLQRAGRAGRRGETRSIVFTICQSNPHDQHVFKNPLWAFITPMNVPQVSLNSKLLVQKHVNSYLLSCFFKAKLPHIDNRLKLDIKSWILPLDDSIANHFINWLLHLDIEHCEKIRLGLMFLLKGTSLELIDLKEIVLNTSDMYQKFSAQLIASYEGIQKQIQGYDDIIDHQFKPLIIDQQVRLLKEYLLSTLAKEGVLPAYGFPTNIVTFDTLNMSSATKFAEEKDKYNREIPSREAHTGLIEYAPNAQLAINGLVYKSEGVLLNWQAPATLQDNIVEEQSISTIWLCHSCGSSNIAHLGSQINHCDICDSTELTQIQYLEPKGFSVDISKTPIKRLTPHKMHRPEPAWIQANGEWQDIPHHKLGKYRISSEGHVFYHVSGVNRQGYAVCMDCGRADEMTESGQVPNIFLSTHFSLRLNHQGKHGECTGSIENQHVLTNLHLGYRYKTDVMEFIFEINHIKVVDKNLAFTLAVVLRRASASILGIDVRELGCDIRTIDADGVKEYIVAIYDINPAGYVSSLEGRLKELLYLAEKSLDCPLNCDSACYSCLLDYDFRFKLKNINRGLAKNYLKNSKVLSSWSANPDNDYFPFATFPEKDLLLNAIDREVSKPNIQELRVFLTGDMSFWSIKQSKLESCIDKWLLKVNCIKIIISPNSAEKMTKKVRQSLKDLIKSDLVSVWIGKGNVTNMQGQLCAQIITNELSVFWVERTADVSIPNMYWGVKQTKLWKSSLLSNDIRLIKKLVFRVNHS